MERFNELKAMDSLMMPFNRTEKEKLAQKILQYIKYQSVRSEMKRWIFTYA